MVEKQQLPAGTHHSVSKRPKAEATDTTVGEPTDFVKPSSTGTLGKAMEVLDVISAAETPLRFTDVLNKVDQPRGTLHRQISNLIAEGLVVMNSDHSYAPGIRILKLAARAWSKNTFRSVAEPHIRALHEATGETVHLGLLNGLEVVYLDKIESRQTVRMHSQVGNASPLYCTGIGKAMMAVLPESQAQSIAEQFDYIQHTPTTLVTPAALLSELEVIRQTGTAHDREEHEPGIYCVAAAVGGCQRTDIAEATGTTIAGVSVTSPAYRLDGEIIKKWELLVCDTTQAIEDDLIAGLGPRNQQ